VIQERRFERLGGTRTIEVDVRWIAATNRNLEEMMVARTFREDLYHRLAVFPIRLPPLRERRRDLLPLAEALLARLAADLGRPPLKLDDLARERITQGPWRGNVRELGNALERAAILAEGDVVRGDDLYITMASSPSEVAGRTMEEIERAAIGRALSESGGNRRRAAERLGIGERTLYDKLKRYGLGA
jgi:two-component system response regulator AtoC